MIELPYKRRETDPVSINPGDPRKHRRFDRMTPDELCASVHPAGADPRAQAMAKVIRRLQAENARLRGLDEEEVLHIPLMREQAL